VEIPALLLPRYQIATPECHISQTLYSMMLTNFSIPVYQSSLKTCTKLQHTTDLLGLSLTSSTSSATAQSRIRFVEERAQLLLHAIRQRESLLLRFLSTLPERLMKLNVTGAVWRRQITLGFVKILVNNTKSSS